MNVDRAAPWAPLPRSFNSTRSALHELACYVVAPARRARTGKISLVAFGAGFATPPLDDHAGRVAVDGDRLMAPDGTWARIVTLSQCAEHVGVSLSPAPDVGRDLPPFRPDAVLEVDIDASAALGSWYAVGARLLAELTAVAGVVDVSAGQLWPEHFDLASVAQLDSGVVTNVGVSPGDAFVDEPYLYVGPHGFDGRTDGYWNAPFGAYVTRSQLTVTGDPHRAALAFAEAGIRLLES